MDDEREFEEARERTSAETVYTQDPPMKPYCLSDQGMLLASTTEDEEPTTAIPPSDGEVQSSQTVAGTTQFSSVMSRTLAYDFVYNMLHVGCTWIKPIGRYSTTDWGSRDQSREANVGN